MNKPLVCDDCRAKRPFELSCIHTFAPSKRATGIAESDPKEEARELADAMRMVKHRGAFG